MADLVYLAEMQVYDPATGGVRWLRYGTHRITTGPTDNPAHVTYLERVQEAASLRRTIGRGTQGGARDLSYGELVLNNEDGALDVLDTYGFDGRRVRIKQGEPGDAFADFATVLVAAMEQPEVTRSRVIVRLRDMRAVLDVPFQPTRYAGDVLPDGLEGGPDDLKGKPKPRLLGTVRNMPVPLVNTSKLIYQVNDGPATVSMVYDRGLPLSVAVRTWVERTSGFGGSVIIADVAYGEAVWVAVGTNGELRSSADAITWTGRTSQFGASDIQAVTYGGGQFVAVGDAGKISTSPDGVTWTARSSNFGTDPIYDVAYGDGVFIAVGHAGQLDRSTDGVTWSAQSTGLDAGFFIGAAAYGKGLFVIVNQVGELASSPDGITWTLGTFPWDGGTDIITFGGLDFGGDGFVAVGIHIADQSAVIATSLDGLTWTVRDASMFEQGLFSAAYGNGYWVAAGGNFGLKGNAGFSIDGGVTWTIINAQAFASDSARAVAYGDGVFVAAGTVASLASTPATGGTYADESDLLDDALAPAPGTFKYWPAGGYFRLGSLPDGLITCDASAGQSASDRYAGRLFGDVLNHPLGYPTENFVFADIEALDAAAPYELGFWTMDEGVTVRQVCDLLAMSVGAWWGADAAGRFRITQLTLPSGSPVLTLDEHDIVSIERLKTPLPAWRTVVRYGRLGVVQPTDLAGGVSDTRRGELAREWREAKAEDASIRDVHLLAGVLVEDSLLVNESDAQAEATRRQAINGSQRHLYEITLKLDATTAALDLGNVVSVTHRRFNLSGGEDCRIVAVEPDPARRRVRLVVWR